MAPVTPKNEVSIKDLAKTILNGSTVGKDSITTYLNNPKSQLKDILSLRTVLRANDTSSEELINLLHVHFTLELLPNAERVCFYYGCVHSKLLSTAVNSIYYGLDQNDQVSDDVQRAIIYLSQACRLEVGPEKITKEVLLVFGQAKDLVDFSLLLRPHFFITSAQSREKNDALLTIANKLKGKTLPRNLALSLIGIWFQTKTNPISLRRINIKKAAGEVQAMLEESKKSSAPPIELSTTLWVKTKNIMHHSVRIRVRVR